MSRFRDAVRVLNGRARVRQVRSRAAGDDYWYSPFRQPSATGIEVDEETALESTAIFAGIALIADCMGMMALHVYRATEDGGHRRTEVAAGHPLDRVLSLAPNPVQSAFEFWRWMYVSMKIRGNAYAEIVRDDRGVVTALWPMLSDRVRISFPDGNTPVYVVRLPDGRTKVMNAGAVLHLTDFHTKGFVGESNLLRHSESIGLTIALEQYAAKFFGNGGMTGAVLIFPPEANFERGDKALYRAEFEKLNSGLDNAHRVAIIEEGASYKQVGVSPKDSQAIACRTYQIGEASRILRVPRVMLGDLADAHQKNVEQLFLQFVTLTLQPLAVLAEQKMVLRLLDGEDGLSVRFATQTLLKADLLTRVDAYLKEITHGIITPNEARDELGLNPYAEDLGNHPMILSNIMPLQAALDNTPGQTLPTPDPSNTVDGDPGTRDAEHHCNGAHGRETRETPERVNLRGEYEPKFLATLLKALKQESGDVGAAAEKYLSTGDIAGFEGALDAFYKAHPAAMREIMRATMTDYLTAVAVAAGKEVDGGDAVDLAALVDDALKGASARWAQDSRARLKSLIESGMLPEDLAQAVADELDGWSEGRASGAAQKEAVRAEVETTRRVWMKAGIEKVTWQTSSPCPLCAPLQGRVVGITASFLSAGTTLVPGGNTNPMPIKKHVNGPPLHTGCKCWLTPGG